MDLAAAATMRSFARSARELVDGAIENGSTPAVFRDMLDMAMADIGRMPGDAASDIGAVRQLLQRQVGRAAEAGSMASLDATVLFDTRQALLALGDVSSDARVAQIRAGVDLIHHSSQIIDTAYTMGREPGVLGHVVADAATTVEATFDRAAMNGDAALARELFSPREQLRAFARGGDDAIEADYDGFRNLTTELKRIGQLQLV